MFKILYTIKNYILIRFNKLYSLVLLFVHFSSFVMFFYESLIKRTELYFKWQDREGRQNFVDGLIFPGHGAELKNKHL